MADDLSQPFRKMADRIDHNKSSTFGGAAVIIPPTGDAVEVLMLDSQGDVAQFLSTVGQRLKQIAEKLDAEARRSAAYGR